MSALARFDAFALGQYPPEPQAPPSTYAIAALVDGEPGALGRVVVLTAFRAVPVGLGLYLVGDRERLIKKSLAVSGTISLAMIGYALGRKRGWWT